MKGFSRSENLTPASTMRHTPEGFTNAEDPAAHNLPGCLMPKEIHEDEIPCPPGKGSGRERASIMAAKPAISCATKGGRAKIATVLPVTFV